MKVETEVVAVVVAVLEEAAAAAATRVFVDAGCAVAAKLPHGAKGWL